MIRYLRHADIDKAEWDRKLLVCPNKLWYAQSHVLNIASPGWDALVDEVSGGMMPLTWRKKFGVAYLFQPFGLQQLGVFSPLAITRAVSSEFIAAIPEDFKLVEIGLNQHMPVLPVPGWSATEHPDQLIDLSAGIAAVRANYASGHQRNLRTVAEGEAATAKPMTAEAFCGLFQRTTAQRFKGIDARGLRSLLPLLRAGRDRAEVDIIGIGDEHGNWRAGAAFVHWQGRSILLKSAADEVGRDMHAMFRLVDDGLERACERSSIMDFAGSEHPGTARFYKGFGATPAVYLRLSRNNLPFWLKPFKR